MHFVCLFNFLNVCDSLSIWQVSKSIATVEELEILPSAHEFYFTHSSPIPFVCRGLHQHEFDDTYLLSVLGDEKVQLIESALKENRESRCLYDMKWSQFLSEYNKSSIYLVSQVPPQLRHLLHLPPFLSCGGLGYFIDTPILWLSGNQTKSVIHRDSQHNWHCVLSGEKSFLLWNRNFTEIATPEMGWTTDRGYGEWSGNIDVDNVNVIRFPGWNGLSAEAAVLTRGDCIYIPEGWFHYVESKNGSRTNSFHVWFDIPPVWVDFDECAVEQTAFSISKCVFEDDLYSTGVASMGRIPGRTSVC